MEEMIKRMALLGDVWVLGLLALASAVSWAVILERSLAFRSRLKFPAFMASIEKALQADDLIAARQAARSADGLEARVTLAGLEAAGRGAASAEEAMTARLVIERSRLERGLVFLGTLGNNAPFLGLLGTVLGVMKAFNDLSSAGTGGGVAAVMTGISSALAATAMGIFVAIPAVAANNYFLARLRGRCSGAQALSHILQVHLKDSGRAAAGAGV